jgi:hypothetical protein
VRSGAVALTTPAVFSKQRSPRMYIDASTVTLLLNVTSQALPVFFANM